MGADGREHGRESEDGRPFVLSLDDQGEVQDGQGQIEDVLPARIRVHVGEEAAQEHQGAEHGQLRHA